MARVTTEIEQPDTNERIAAVLEQLAAQAPVEEIGYGHPKFQQQLRDEGHFKEFSAPVYQNGREAVARSLTAETIEHAPKLRPGKYWGGMVDVSLDNRGRVHLAYKCADVTDRMKQPWKNFDELIGKIWDEMHATA